MENTYLFNPLGDPLAAQRAKDAFVGKPDNCSGIVGAIT